MFFVVTTGRSGSKSISEMLNQHPLCVCQHEPHKILIKLSAEYCHHQIGAHELQSYLFEPKSIFPNRIGYKLYGESDHRLSFFIPQLKEVGTSTKFLWLLRDGRSVIASTYVRGWYRPNTFLQSENLWEKYRIQGDLCLEMDTNEWMMMTPFEKCCWYWSYTNRRIEDELNKLNSSSWMMIHLEDLNSFEIGRILDFLELPLLPLKKIHSNSSETPPYHHKSWTIQENSAFEYFCGKEMDRYYPNWRNVENFNSSAGEFEPSVWKILMSLSNWTIKKSRRRLQLRLQ
jgi:hypothetical protein